MTTHRRKRPSTVRATVARVCRDFEVDLIDAVLRRVGVAVLGDVDLKSSARHSQRLHPGRNVLGQCAARGYASRGELLRLRAIAFERCGKVFSQHSQIELGTFQCL